MECLFFYASLLFLRAKAAQTVVSPSSFKAVLLQSTLPLIVHNGVDERARDVFIGTRPDDSDGVQNRVVEIRGSGRDFSHFVICRSDVRRVDDARVHFSARHLIECLPYVFRQDQSRLKLLPQSQARERLLRILPHGHGLGISYGKPGHF
jgi:hypothetical protein